MALTNVQLSEYWSLLDEINRLAQEDLVALWRMLDGLPIGEAWAVIESGVPEIVSLYRSTTVDTAMLFYEETQGLKFASESARIAGNANQAQMMASLRWAVFNPGNAQILGLVGGIIQKHVADGARQYALDGFTAAGAGWYRAARPGACAFCRMLATRAATTWGPYGSAEAASFTGRGNSSRARGDRRMPDGSEFHPNCSCIPVRATEYEVPNHVKKWTAEYHAAVEESGNAFATEEILSNMRKISGHNH